MWMKNTHFFQYGIDQFDLLCFQFIRKNIFAGKKLTFLKRVYWTNPSPPVALCVHLVKMFTIYGRPLKFMDDPLA